MSPGAGYALGAITSATGTIADNDFAATPLVSISGPASLLEGNVGSTAFTFTVQRAGDLGSALEIPYIVTGSGLNPAGSDDVEGDLPLEGAVSFAPGQSTATVTLAVAGDLAIEANEGFVLTLLDPPAGADAVDFGQRQAVATIIHDDGVFVPPENLRPPGGGFGDPHLTTLDGLGYDFQAVGEFVLVEGTHLDGDSLMVQVRTAAVGDFASVFSAVATEIEGTGGDPVRVTIEAGRASPLQIDGVPVTIDPEADSVLAGIGRVYLVGADEPGGPTTYVVDYGNYMQALTVRDYGTRLDVELALDPSWNGRLRGLLGNFDGDAENEFATRSGGLIADSDLSFDALYETYGNSWRISQDESLFDYVDGKGPEDFTDLKFPRQAPTLDSFPDQLVNSAVAMADQLGIKDPVQRQAAILDFLLTGDSSFFDSAAAAPVAEAEAAVTDAPEAAAAVGIGTIAVRQPEGTGGETAFEFTIYRTGSAAEALSITYQVVGSGPNARQRGGFRGWRTARQHADPGEPARPSAPSRSTSRPTRPRNSTRRLRSRSRLRQAREPQRPSSSHRAQARSSRTTTVPSSLVLDLPRGARRPATLPGGTEDESYVIRAADLLAGFRDLDGDTLLVESFQPTNGTLTQTGDGWTFNPDAHFNGTVTLSYDVADRLDGSVSATQSFTLAPVNDQPIANAGSSTTDEDTAVSGRVTGSDVESGAALTYALVSGPQHGTLVFDPSGDYTYTPGADYFGDDSFTFTASDGSLTSAVASISPSVSQVNDARALEGTNKADTFIDARYWDTTYLASNGDDVVDGADGADQLFGGNGRDELIGGSGRDTLAGQNGNDRLTGGADADRFVFAGVGGDDVITDFVLNEDAILLLDGMRIVSSREIDTDAAGGVDATVLQFNGGSATLLGIIGLSNPDTILV